MVDCLNEAHGDSFAVYNGDCVEILRQIPDKSIGHCIYSPPFGDLFTYSDSVADLGNSGSDDEFFGHYDFVCRQLIRVMKPGRIVAVHCSDLPTRKWKDGFIGLKPFSDQLREAHERAGFIFYRRVTIWKCPVVEQGRTHSRNLLYGELRKDSTMSAPGLPDYLMVFRTPGENDVPLRHYRTQAEAHLKSNGPDDVIVADDHPQAFKLEQWREWASPVWMTVDQTNVLGGVQAQREARDHADERHVCPLQLDVIRRSVIMWSNPGETVLSPFMGIGSEGFVAIQEGRRFVGVELKESYFRQAARHIDGVDRQDTLLAAAE